MSTPHRTSGRSRKGFTRASTFLRGRIRDASGARGFAQSKLLTHWDEIAGEEIAKISRPVEVTYSKGGFGAVLVLLTTGAHAPVLDMEKEKLRARVNTVYGYNAIGRIRITQTAPTGFAEGQVAFAPAPKKQPVGPSSHDVSAARNDVGQVEDSALRDALILLGANIKSKASDT
ncbi:MAG: DciA family protein [Pseudomonadota bacterium]